MILPAWNVGDLTITLRAGKFTPEDRVDVAIKTLMIPCLKLPSIMSLSSNVSPKIKQVFAYIYFCYQTLELIS